ncbi:MAG: SusC/RagA family TonB-linked outer membrane protein [Prolixibacteraceae bacterium]
MKKKQTDRVWASHIAFKCLRMMKLTFGLFLILVAQGWATSAYSQKAVLNLDMKNVKIVDVLEEIEDQTDFYFLFNYEQINSDKKISVSLTNAAIGETLDLVLKGTDLKYTIKERQIVISKNEMGQPGNSGFSLQQQRTVSGLVTNTANEPVPGATVTLQGSVKGTITDANGRFTLTDVPGNAVLLFSFMGMKTQAFPLSGQSSLTIIMEEEMIGVEEVVVTAFGINREKKQLSYATQQVAGEQLAATGNNDAMKGMQGKIAGVTIRQVNGSPGAETKVTIRGSSSINGSNDPLYIIDGFPVDGSISFDLDPNEIENISVLKGATAAALYGLRASNGVILISTKRGKGNEKNKPTVTFSSNYSFDRLSVFPETQEVYGQGINTFDAYSAYAWGLKISEMGTYTNQLGEQEEARVYDNARDFIRTGGTLNSNINVSNKFDKGNYSIGVGYSDQTGIVPNTDMERISVKLAGDYEISDKFKIGTLVNYSKHTTNGTNQSGGNSSVFYAAFDTPPSYNLKGKPTHVEGNEYQQINFRGSHDNIYWAVAHNIMKYNISSLIGSVSFDYNPAEWLNLNYRTGIEDVATDELTVYELGSGNTGGRTNPPSGGELTEAMKKRRSFNSTFIASVSQKLSDKLEFDFMLGHEYYDYDYKGLSATGNDFTIGGFHQLSNANKVNASKTWNRKRSYAFFGNLNVAYHNMLFLTLTGRNDVVSNMPRDNRSFFYPSAGLAFVVTEAMQVKPELLSFGKIRMSYAEVGQAGSIYATNTTYAPGSAGGFSFPFNGVNAFTLANSLKSADLQPENTRSVEFGVNLGFLKNRLNLDYTFYHSKSDGQIFSVPVSSATGFTTEIRNAGEMLNKGHEIVLNIKPVVTKNFNWDFTTNFTTYVSKVVKLAEGIDMLRLGGNRVSIVAKEGEEYPILRGTGYARDPESGKIVVLSDQSSPSAGMPLQSTGDIDLGKANPDFEVNFLNTFKYRKVSLYAQVDWRQGGKISSGNSRLSKLYGTHYDTRFRDEDYVEDAVKGHYDNNGTLVIDGENDIVIKRGYQYYAKVMDPIRESNVYDASFIRLREVKLSYDLPASLLRKMYVRNASVYVIGRNLWLIKSGLPHYDPEMSDTSANAIGETYADYPQISSFGFGINLTF